jgi:ankyrin repeat protein
LFIIWVFSYSQDKIQNIKTLKNNHTLEQKLFLAVKDNNIDKVEDIISSGVDINYQNKDGQTALFIAASNNYYFIVSLLIKNSINIHIKDYMGYEAYWYAYKNNSIESLDLIMQSNKKKTNTSDSLEDFIKNFKKEPIDEM